MSYNTHDIYRHYIELGGDLPFKSFREVISSFNVAAMDGILEGRELEMEKGLSRLSIMRIARDFSRPVIDWKESYALKAQLLAEGETLFSEEENPDGAKWFVYFTDPWYLRFYWEKKHCQIKNKTAYRFDATRGAKGNKTKLKELLAADSLAYLNFRTRGKA